MKMPSINVVFKEKGISAIERSERGIVLMILKEETLPSETEVNLYTADDIPKELSDSNREQMELALRGYVNSPKKVIAEIISSETEDYTDILKVIENKRFDYLVIPDIETSHIDTIATWVKGMRTNKDKMIKAVLPDCTADTEGVINFVNKTIRTKSKTYTTAQVLQPHCRHHRRDAYDDFLHLCAAAGSHRLRCVDERGNGHHGRGREAVLFL